MCKWPCNQVIGKGYKIFEVHYGKKPRLTVGRHMDVKGDSGKDLGKKWTVEEASIVIATIYIFSWTECS